ncbi:MAG: hypothetical protein AAFR59_05750, partial [Bacteroidota bacterium]
MRMYNVRAVTYKEKPNVEREARGLMRKWEAKFFIIIGVWVLGICNKKPQNQSYKSKSETAKCSDYL